MQELLYKYLIVYSSSMLKAAFGPIMGLVFELSILETILLTAAGIMSTVILITYIGAGLRKKLIEKFAKNKKRFTKKNRKIVSIWRKYGLLGITFLTPVLFSPPGGAIIVVSFGEKNKKIFTYMLFSSLFWATVHTGFYFYLGREFVHQFIE
ncbi:hypothetical protein AAG747_23215 [Rapidithrix thailandica]|uniref:Small multi-drug export protein n=1 Tax=Rapidithrix thailandica TaxID=413964 RepID=A0AAW9SGA3_9BACT